MGRGEYVTGFTEYEDHHNRRWEWGEGRNCATERERKGGGGRERVLSFHNKWIFFKIHSNPTVLSCLNELFYVSL